MGCCPAGSDYAIYAKSSKNEITSFRGVVVWITKAQYPCSHPHSGTEFSDDWQELTYVFCLPQAQLKFSQENTTRKRLDSYWNEQQGWEWKKLGYSPNMAITQFQHLNDGITFLLFFFVDLIAVFISLRIFNILILKPFQKIVLLFNSPITWI